MASELETVVRHVSDVAGWKTMAPDSEGVYRYFFEEGLDLEIRSPNGRLLVLSADLGEMPEKGTPAYEERLREVAKLSAGIVRRRASVVSIYDGRLELYRVINMNEATDEDYVYGVRDFLNDEAWWKACLNVDAAVGMGQSGFSLNPEAWFPSEIKF